MRLATKAGRAAPRAVRRPVVRAQGLDARPLGVAIYVGEVQDSRHQRFQRAVRHHLLDGASPVATGFTGALQADVSVVLAQGPVLVHELLGVGRAQELTLLMGCVLKFFLRCKSRVRASQRAASGSEPAEIRQKKADKAVWILLA